MKKITTFLMLLTLLIGAGTTAQAQTGVTVGAQVTSEGSIVSGTPYVLKTGADRYITDNGTNYDVPNAANSATEASVYFLISNGDGTWKIKNFYTGKYWGVPVYNAALAPAEEASAGSWTWNFSSNVAYPTAPDAGSTVRGIDRSSGKVWGWSTGTNANHKVYVYEVSLSATSLDEFVDKDISVSASAADNLTTGEWYVMFDRGANHGYLYENSSSHTLYNTSTVPGGYAPDNAKYLVRLVSGTDGKYYLQTGFGNYFGTITHSAAVTTTALKEQLITVSEIAGTAGHFYLASAAGTILDANVCSSNDATVVGWGTTVPTSTGGNNDWAFYQVDLVDSWAPTIDEVYTISNANDRGALTFDPEVNSYYVWSSGKDGATAFDSGSANCQWVICPAGVSGQFYLYNVGARKFAIPSSIASGASNAWYFSDNAVAVVFERVSTGYKIKAASTPVSGTNAAYVSVSNSYTGPIINYNDEGSIFTITKVDGQDQSTAANAAVAKLIKSQTPLTSYPQASGWYAIQIKSKTGAAAYAGRYLQSSTTLYNGLYPLTFTGGIDVQPAITDPSFLTYIDYTSWDVNTWQLPDGRYLVDNGNSKFPTASQTPGNVICGYDNGNYFKSPANYYADPYNNGDSYFIGETSYMRTAYNVYPVDLATAGLAAWKVMINNGSESVKLTCTRNDVSGLTSVYNNGYFFLPTGETPTAGQFTMEGMIGDPLVDAENKTITVTYDPSISMLVGNVNIVQGYQTTGKGNTMQALLRAKLTPFKDCSLATVNASITGAAQLDNIEVYITTNDEIRAAGASPTKISGAVSLADNLEIPVEAALTAGQSVYLWITADVKSTATEWETIDAALTSISYSNDYTVAESIGNTTLDLTAVGNPSGVMRIFKVQSELWTASTVNTQYYRIPTIINTADGGIVAFTDDRHTATGDLGNHKIDMVVRKSMDNGATWSAEQTIATGDGSSAAAYGYGDAAVVRTNSGKLICIMAAGKNGFVSGMLHMGYSESTDNGATWSTVKDIYADIDKNGAEITSAFTTAGKGVTFSNGRVAFAMNGKTSSGTNEYVLYSDDEGTSWKLSPSVYSGADESKLEIMNDNSLLVSVRRGSFNSMANRGYNRTTGDASGDGINTWGSQGVWGNEMNANGCNADILYYNRSTENPSRPDVIFHTLTKNYTGHRKDLRLCMSFDQGETWYEAFQLQPGWAAYSSMQKLANGDLAVIYEDGSIGNEDLHDCYAITYVVISKDMIDAKIDELYDEYYDSIHNPVATIISQGETNGSAPWGSWTPASGWAKSFTTNANSGFAGVVVSTADESNLFNRETDYGQRVFCIKPSAIGATDEFTITAPEGYYIKGYSIGGFYWTSGETYTLSSADGTISANVNQNSGTPNMLTVNDVNATTTSFKMKALGSTNNKFACITQFTVQLSDIYPVSLKAVGDANYATLYLPFDVKTDADTKAYYIPTVTSGYAYLREVTDNEIPARTAVILINETSTAATFTVANDLYQQVSESDNHLKGTLSAMNLDLGDATPYYSLGKKNDAIGFYKFDKNGTTTITLGANKAYLDTTAPGGSVKGFTLAFDTETSITETTQKTKTAEGVFDLSGRRISVSSASSVSSVLPKGIYIVNGRKVVVK